MAEKAHKLEMFSTSEFLSFGMSLRCSTKAYTTMEIRAHPWPWMH